METFLAEGFTLSYLNNSQVVIKYADKPLFMPGVYSYNFHTLERMYEEVFDIFSEWILFCIYTNDLEWWLEERFSK